MDQDIKDRFISHGKLWLVLRGGKVVEESTVRVVTLKCKGCGSEYEIRCTVDRGGMQGPKHCCYCSKVFQEPWEPPHDPFDQTPR